MKNYFKTTFSDSQTAILAIKLIMSKYVVCILCLTIQRFLFVDIRY